MRGKLRDKRTTTKREASRREIIERRRPGKRDNHIVTWLNQDVEEDYEPEENDEEILKEVPQKK